MAWFRRGKKSTDGQATTEKAGATAPAGDVTKTGAEVTDGPVTGGPRDAAGLSGAGYLRLGAIWLPEIDGMMLTFETDPTQSQVTAVQVLRGDSALQLQAFAAPRTAGIWDEIRAEIAEGLAGRAQVEEVTGPLGAELVARLDGGTMRFIGVDGRRWFLRGVLSGPAATDEAAAAPLREVFSAVVVDRGPEAMGPRELLPLALPTEDAPAREVDTPAGRSADDLNPFERGPEIAEIR